MLKTPYVKLNELEKKKLEITGEKITCNVDKPDYFLKEYTHNTLKRIHDNAFNHLFQHFKELEPDAPDKVIESFIKTHMYIDIKFEDNPLKSDGLKVTVIPKFRKVEDIDFNSPESQLLDEYAFSKVDLNVQYK